MSLAEIVLAPACPRSVSTGSVGASDACRRTRSAAAKAGARSQRGTGRRRRSEGLANREIDLKPVVGADLPEAVGQVEADGADRRRDPEPAADAREEGRPREVGHARSDQARVEEHHAAEPAIEREAPLEVRQDSQVAALRVALRVERPDVILLVAAHGGAAASLEAVLDHEVLGVQVRRGDAEARRDGEHGPGRPRKEPRILEPVLHEVDVAAERRAADLERGKVIAAQLGIGRQVAKLEREKSLHAGDEVVPRGDAAVLDEVRIDVAALKLLDPVPEPAAQALGMVGRLLGPEEVGQQIALQGQRRAEPVADEADLLLALLEYDDLGAPVRAEDPRLAIVELRAIALLARALADRGAAAGAEQVVVAE